ncbi:MAG: 50S ribosomal protein L15 [Paludibacteraceae bacterium]|jgi:large subunit ribosomal protein L15|nr:50S ribosomal protein L15 [Paludibacteraceae bacterium]
MDLSNLKAAAGSTHSKRRLGRGQGSGYGGTSTRGSKGAGSRSGYSHKIGFEGGQMPLQRLLPKFGFKNINRVSYRPVNLADLQTVSEKLNVSEIDKAVLAKAGLAKAKELVKILGKGAVSKSLTVTADAFSASAKAAIEAAGGKVVTLNEK